MQRGELGAIQNIDGLLGIGGGEAGEECEKFVSVAGLPEAEGGIESQLGHFLKIGLQVERSLVCGSGVAEAMLLF